MHTPSSGRVVAVALLAGVVFLVTMTSLSVTGHPRWMILVFLTTTGWGLYSLGAIRQADRMSKARVTGTVPSGGLLRKYDSLALPHPPSTVWELLLPAVSAAALSDDVVKGFHVPGTPQGLGEQQAFMTTSGETSVVEVIEYVHGRRAVTKIVSPPTPVPVRSVYDLQPQGTGCVLTFGLEVDVPSGDHRWTREQEEQIAEYLNKYLQRIAAALDARSSTPWRPPAG